MPRGGFRPGSGRKPGKKKPVTLAWRLRHPVVPVPSVNLDDEDVQALREPPDGISEGAAAFWRQWSGQAIVERTLTPSTAAGFKQLCQQWAYLAELDDRIRQLGTATKEASPYFLTYLKLAQRLDASLARFKLTAFGKPAVLEKPKAAANPWAAVGAK